MIIWVAKHKHDNMGCKTSWVGRHSFSPRQRSFATGMEGLKVRNFHFSLECTQCVWDFSFFKCIQDVRDFSCWNAYKVCETFLFQMHTGCVRLFFFKCTWRVWDFSFWNAQKVCETKSFIFQTHTRCVRLLFSNTHGECETRMVQVDFGQVPVFAAAHKEQSALTQMMVRTPQLQECTPHLQEYYTPVTRAHTPVTRAHTPRRVGKTWRPCRPVGANISWLVLIFGQSKWKHQCYQLLAPVLLALVLPSQVLLRRVKLQCVIYNKLLK